MKKNIMIWTGRFFSTLVALMMAMSAGMKLSGSTQVVDAMVAHYGYPKYTLLPLGVVELTCLVIYLIPQTAVLGAILLTGYLGGAVATQVHAEELYIFPVLVGAFAWLGLYLRDARIRDLIPFRFGSGN
jgi:hypothetical protein